MLMDASAFDARIGLSSGHQIIRLLYVKLRLRRFFVVTGRRVA